jgi:hypothetical protein
LKITGQQNDLHAIHPIDLFSPVCTERQIRALHDGRQPRISSEHNSGISLIAAVAAAHEFSLLKRCSECTPLRRSRTIPRAKRGEIWMVDLGLAIKVRPS